MSLIALDSVPALIQRERTALAEIASPEAAADAEKRVAAIAELTKRAGLAVPIQNEATFLRAEALERLAVLVDEERNGKYHHGSSELRKIPPQRITEGRALAQTGAIEEARQEAERRPDQPVSMSDILKRAKRRQREAALGGRREKREAEAREHIAALDSPYAVAVADLREWRPENVAAIITDPPYVGDSLPLYEALRDFAVDVLPEGAPLVVMTWQAILPDVIEALRHDELAYRWTICWRYANTENTVDYKRRVFDCWKPVLVYHRGALPEDARMFRDEIANAGPDKGFHEWGQSVDGFERLVTSFSEPGDVVCDPFLGGGTTAVAALASARRFVGCDVDPEAVATTERRLDA
jgi:site-specific DNA-methyltransferase (adenine-specific)